MSRSLALAALLAAAVPAAAQEALPTVEYSHGAPSAESQRMLWLVNRARSDPVGEGDRIFADYGVAVIW